ncbi:MAG: cytochrome c oxidase subunit I [Thermoleophilia bacterium]
MSEVVMPAGPVLEAARPRGLGAWLTTTDHKRIGLLYIGTALAFFLVAVAFAMLMRTQLIRPGMRLLSPEQYNQIFSMHGTTMVFLFGMPMLIGLANYLVPLQIGARDMAFPRVNALSYWLLLFGGLLLYSSFAFGGALDTGWFSYAPLTLKAYSPHDGVTFWTVSLVLLGASSILGSINFIVTCLRFRAPGMRLWQMPVFAVATFINSFLILFAFPSLTAAIALLYLDRQYGTSFFDPAGGGDPVIWQHLFWFFGHPEVYILILPAFGIMSEVVPVFSRKPLFGRESMLVMLAAIGFLGFLVWAHHMFATGLPTIFNAIMAGTSMLIAIPTGVKIFNWLATMWGGSLRFRPPLLFACSLIALFTIGGITGVTLAVVPWDWQVTDTYYVVGHLHNVLFAGTVFAVFAGIYYWFPKATGRRLDERLGKLHFWLITVGFVVTFMPLYALGPMGMPRRVYTYAPGQGWDTLNLVSSLGGYLIAVAVLVFLFNVVRSLRRGQVAGDNPWGAWTLEWAATSPPPPGNFTWLPVIRSERPLWDLEQAAAAPAAMASASAGEAAASASLTYALAPEPERNTAVPFWAALALLVTAIGLLSTPVVIGLGIALLLIVLAVWMAEPWVQPELPAVPGRQMSFIGAGMLAFIGSETVFFASLIAADIHLRLHAPADAIGAGLATAFPAVNTGVLIASGVAAHYAQVAYRRRRPQSFNFLLGLTIVLGTAFLAGQAWEYTHLGFGLSASLTASAFFTLTGFHGLHVACGIAALVFLSFRVRREWRVWPGAPSRGSAGMVDAGTYYWHFVDAVWVVVFVVVYLL